MNGFTYLQIVIGSILIAGVCCVIVLDALKSKREATFVDVGDCLLTNFKNQTREEPSPPYGLTLTVFEEYTKLLTRHEVLERYLSGKSMVVVHFIKDLLLIPDKICLFEILEDVLARRCDYMWLNSIPTGYKTNSKTYHTLCSIPNKLEYITYTHEPTSNYGEIRNDISILTRETTETVDNIQVLMKEKYEIITCLFHDVEARVVRTSCIFALPYEYEYTHILLRKKRGYVSKFIYR